MKKTRKIKQSILWVILLVLLCPLLVFAGGENIDLTDDKALLERMKKGERVVFAY